MAQPLTSRLQSLETEVLGQEETSPDWRRSIGS
jgi:hypothetical protein